jgi:YHS domain-containing protein
MRNLVWLTAMLLSIAALTAAAAPPMLAPRMLVAQDSATPAPADEVVPMSFDAPPVVGTKALCATTKTEFTVEADTTRSEYEGRHYVFCCPGCKTSFDANPAKYVEKAK